MRLGGPFYNKALKYGRRELSDFGEEKTGEQHYTGRYYYLILWTEIIYRVCPAGRCSSDDSAYWNLIDAIDNRDRVEVIADTWTK